MKGSKILGINADWKAVAFCVLAAFTFWFFNAMNHDYTVDIYYPIEIKYDDTRVIPLEPLPKKIKINTTGYGWRILRKYLGFKTNAIVYRPDNLPKKNVVASNELYSVISRQISDIEFNYIVQDSIFFDFDYLREKKVKVIVDSSAVHLAPSYQITTPLIISPDFVIFQGPSSLLKKVPDSLRLEIATTDIKEDFEEDIKVPEQGFPKVEMLNKEVKVRFGVNKFEKQSTVVDIQTLNFPKDTSLINFEKNIILTYFIKEEDKNKVARKDFLASINYRELDKTDSTITPKLIKKPPFIQDYYFTPYAIKINYKK